MAKEQVFTVVAVAGTAALTCSLDAHAVILFLLKFDV
jgi:hypothetical protein